MTPPGRVAAVVLAAGASSRMGRPKPLLPIEGTTYLEYLLSKLAEARLNRVLVVLGCKADEVREGTEAGDADFIESSRWEQGMLSSIQAAVLELEDSQVDALVLLPVDQPRVASSTIDAVVGAWDATRAPVAVPTYQGRRGHPVIFDRSTWPALLAAPAQEGARFVVRGCGDAVACVPVDDPWVLLDADTPREHDRMRIGIREA